MGHIINLIAQAYLFGQDYTSFEDEFKKAGAPSRREMWRKRGELGKLHNIVAHIMASGKRSEVFRDLQHDANTGAALGKIWQLVLDGGIRWNALYTMIRRAIELREAICEYQRMLRHSKDDFDIETRINDHLCEQDWDTLEMIRDQLELLFRLTKDLEGNADLKEGVSRASHGALWEILPVFDTILDYFEDLEQRSRAGEFKHHTGIQSSITLAWNAANKWYEKTDNSIAWVAVLVLHPRWKWSYFDRNWDGAAKRYIIPAKAAFRALWENDYKTATDMRNSVQLQASDQLKVSFLEEQLMKKAPVSATRVPLPTARKDQLQLYLEEPPTGDIPVMEYWRSREQFWPQLAKMAYDFLAVPAMSAECERVFSSCAKITTAESSRLSEDILWHQEVLKNWQNRGAIQMSTAWNAVQLDL
jgi:hypothetical protein